MYSLVGGTVVRVSDDVDDVDDVNDGDDDAAGAEDDADDDSLLRLSVLRCFSKSPKRGRLFSPRGLLGRFSDSLLNVRPYVYMRG